MLVRKKSSHYLTYLHTKLLDLVEESIDKRVDRLIILNTCLLPVVEELFILWLNGQLHPLCKVICSPSRTSRWAWLAFLPGPPSEIVTLLLCGALGLTLAPALGFVGLGGTFETACAGFVMTSLASAANFMTCTFSSNPVSYGFTFTIITARPPPSLTK